MVGDDDYAARVGDRRAATEIRTTYLVGRADRILRGALESELEAHGPSLTEVTVLSVLAARPGLSNARLARRALVTPQAMHKVIRSLERQGFVERAAGAGGGRSLETTVTELGRAALADAETRMDAAEEVFLAELDPSERRRLRELLLTVTRLDGRPAMESVTSGRRPG